MKREIWLPLCAIVLVAVVIISFVLFPSDRSAAAPVIAVIPQEEGEEQFPEPQEPKEMRGIWVPYMTLKNVTPEKIDSIVENAEKHGYNAIIFHVRPFADALYRSELFPSSHLLDGTQGGEMSFDPLEYVIKAAHSKNIEVHAWINPLRIQHHNGTLPAEISQDNPYNIFRNDEDTSNDCWVIDYKSGKYFNPGEEGARQYIIDGICEIVRDYDVDGIHWDDYFYPADDDSFDDSESYQKYLADGGTLSLIDWRTENVNILVKESYRAVKDLAPEVVFGISPQGNTGNCLNMGADIYEWCSSEGYIDYICPQIYWSFDHPVAPFDEISLKWDSIVTEESVTLYIGLALYKAGTDSDSGTWEGSDDILAREVRFARDNTKAKGFMVYSYEFLDDPEAMKESENLTAELLSGSDL